MSLARMTTLALGSSLVGSTLPIILVNLDLILRFALDLGLIASVIAFIVGFMLLLHGVGTLQAGFYRALRWYRTRIPAIAILNDLPWSVEKGAYVWVWSKNGS